MREFFDSLLHTAADSQGVDVAATADGTKVNTLTDYKKFESANNTGDSAYTALLLSNGSVLRAEDEHELAEAGMQRRYESIERKPLEVVVVEEVPDCPPRSLSCSVDHAYDVPMPLDPRQGNQYDAAYELPGTFMFAIFAERCVLEGRENERE